MFISYTLIIHCCIITEDPDIPGSAVLEFTFELLSIKEGVADGKSYLRLPADDGSLDELSFDLFDVDKDDSITLDEVRLLCFSSND